MKLTNEKSNYLLIEASDLSGTYSHLTLVDADSLKQYLKDAVKILPVLSEIDDASLHLDMQCCYLVKARDEKNDVFLNWSAMLQGEDYCYAELDEGEFDDIFNQYVEDSFREECIISNDGTFKIVVTNVLDEDGGIIEYHTGWIQIATFCEPNTITA